MQVNFFVNSRRRAHIFFLLFFSVAMLPNRVHAQDLKDELSALDDLPEDDLSGETFKPATPTNPLVDKKAEAEIPPSENLEAKEDRSLENELDASEQNSTAKSAPTPIEAMTGLRNEATARLTHLKFRQLQDRVRITMSADRALDWTRELRAKRKQVILELRNTEISDRLLKKVLDTGEFDGPVALVQAFDSKVSTLPSVKVLVQLRQFVEPTVQRSGNDVIVDFPILVDSDLFRERSQSQVVLPETYLSGNTKVAFTGSKISLNVKDADLSDVLNLISKAAGRNFVLSGGVAAKVTLNVRNTPWDQALSIILLNARLGYQKLGNTYRIAPIADLRTEIQESIDAAQKADDLVPLETRLLALSYAKASDVANSLKDFTSKRGKTVIDARTNTVVVSDIPSNIEKITRYVKSIDKQTPQVLIEARIVEASEDFIRNINVNWKLGEVATGPLSDSFVNVGKAGQTLVPVGGTRYSDVRVTGDNGGVRLKLGQLGGIGAVQAILGLAETQNKAKIIGSPRVTVLDNKSATMSQGIQVPVVTPPTANAPATTTYVPAELRLDVTPQVTADGYVLLKTKLFRDTPTAADTASSPIETRRAETEMIVESGKTGVIGGIYTIDSSDTETGWPFLRNIPLLGMLFKSSMTNKKNTRELIMFISPRILNADRARLTASEVSDSSEPMARIDADSVNGSSAIPRDTF